MLIVYKILFATDNTLSGKEAVYSVHSHLRMPSISRRTFRVVLWTTNRETVTVAVLFIKPALVTIPVSAMGGILSDEPRGQRRMIW